MKNIYIKGSHGAHFTPTVNFNYETGICELKGESYLEDTIKFYYPLMEWIKNYIKTIKKELVLNVKLTYFNTSSSKCIIDILNILKAYEQNEGKVVINWYYNDKDEEYEDELEEIEDFMIETGLNINNVPYN